MEDRIKEYTVTLDREDGTTDVHKVHATGYTQAAKNAMILSDIQESDEVVVTSDTMEFVFWDCKLDANDFAFDQQVSKML